LNRRDYNGQTALLWGQLNHNLLAAESGLAPAVYFAEVRQQFEVDHRLTVRAFLWRGAQPHHQIDAGLPQLALPELWDQKRPAVDGEPGEPVKASGPARAGWDVAFLADQALLNNQPPRHWINADDPLDQVFQTPDGERAG